jgi:lipopolysaccharide heptosyltransferase II
MSAVDWPQVRRILVVKLRSIGDTVLSTPSLIALRRYAPQAEIDVLLEDWVAPVLEGHDGVNVIGISTGMGARLATISRLRKRQYDVAFNLHGGTTSTFLTWASGAKHRFGNASYQYSFLYNHLLSSPADFWGRQKMHSAEQQLALVGFAGVSVDDLPKTKLQVTAEALASVESRIGGSQISDSRSEIALLHPGTAFETKRWAPANFARVAEYLANKELTLVAIASKEESATLNELSSAANIPITTYNDLTLPEITALASKARIFIGNDSGIAHIAAAVQTPTVVIFGSSNRTHWRPWTDAPNEIVFNPFDCQPCAGYRCDAFGDSRCIHSVTVDQVNAAVERVLSAASSLTPNPAKH